MSSCIMGLTTKDPYILKEHTKFYKTLRFHVDWANIEQDTAIHKVKKLLTNVWIAGHLSRNVWRSMHFFANFGVFEWLYLVQHWPN